MFFTLNEVFYVMFVGANEWKRKRRGVVRSHEEKRTVRRKKKLKQRREDERLGCRRCL